MPKYQSFRLLKLPIPKAFRSIKKSTAAAVLFADHGVLT